MQRKRNSINVPISTDGYIQKYFGTDIKRILVPNDRNIQNCEIPYVPHSQAENALKDFLIGDPEKDKSLVFTGLTGSGKTPKEQICDLKSHLIENNESFKEDIKKNPLKHTGKHNQKGL